MRAVVGRIDHDGVVRDVQIVECLENLTDVAVVLDHSVLLGALRRLPSVDGIATAHLFQVDMEYLAFLC
jgi:hypothetical protein